MRDFENNKDDVITEKLYGASGVLPCRYHVYLSTDPGMVRSDNEDNYAVNNVYRSLEEPQANLMAAAVGEPLSCTVFDGMGGEANGELASKLCAEVFANIYGELLEGGDIDIDRLVCDSVLRCHTAVREMLDRCRAKRGGSTFAAAVFYNGLVYPYSLGDSRIYIFRDNALRQISNDQTLAMKKLRANIMTAEEALISSDRHKLTAFLGIDPDEMAVPPQIYHPLRMHIGDKLLLCSDGLYDMCSDPEIALILQAPSDSACRALVQAALEKGGEDNITCILVERSE